MRIVVVGGTGLIGSKLVSGLGARGHEVVAASRRTGVDTLTGEGLAAALAGAAVVVDVTDSPSAGDGAVMEFFETSTRNLLAAEAAAGVGHHVALSVVGTGRPPGRGRFRAKAVQERLVETSPVPYSIVRATQFFESARAIAAAAAADCKIRMAPVYFQPVAADDVAEILGAIAAGRPLNGRAEVAGPERFRMDAFFRHAMPAWNDHREVLTDPRAPYLGAELDERTLLPGEGALLGTVRYGDWPGRIAVGGRIAPIRLAPVRRRRLTSYARH
ncbi:SDR family oxidoreductase [Spirillospora sp. NPDC029432]|uniref:SDR family oxidoreductase n=1 Tax=Spirillospora sp. NPDC029432 TaxID=3154599 RepID=UPI003457326D